eukprot:COSAG02_NODE_788_length_17190_cov_18.177403_2_plen_100_part_00
MSSGIEAKTGKDSISSAVSGRVLSRSSDSITGGPEVAYTSGSGGGGACVDTAVGESIPSESLHRWGAGQVRANAREKRGFQRGDPLVGSYLLAVIVNAE